MKQSTVRCIALIAFINVMAVLSLNGSALAAGLSYREIARLELVNGKPQIWHPGTAPHPTPTFDFTTAIDPYDIGAGFSWNPNGSRLAVAYPDGTYIWDIASQKVVQIDSSGGDVAWSPDGKLLAVRNEKRLRILDAERAEVLQTCGTFDGHSNIVWSPDSRVIAVGKTDIPFNDHAIAFCQVGSEVISSDFPAYAVNVLAYSPDGKKLATVSDSYDYSPYTRVYDMTTRQVEVTLEGKYAVAWSPDGKQLAVRTWAGLQICDTENYLPLATIAESPSVIAWHPRGNRIIVDSTGDILAIYDTITGKRLTTLPGAVVWTPGGFTGLGVPGTVKWSPTGTQVAMLDKQRDIRIYSENGTQPMSAATPTVTAAPITLVTGTAAPAQSSTADPTKLHRIESAYYGNSTYSWSADGSRVFRIDASPVMGNLWELYTVAPTVIDHSLMRLTSPTAWAASPDGKQIAVASTIAGNITLQIWDIDANLNVQKVVHTDDIVAIRWSPDGNWIAIATTQNQITLWDAKSKVRVFSMLESSRIDDLTWKADSSAFVTISNTTSSATIYFLDPAHPGSIQKWVLQGVKQINWSPDGTKLAAADLGLVRVWDVSSHRLIDIVKGHYAPIHDVLWSADSRLLVSLSFDYSLSIGPNLIVQDTVSHKMLANMTDLDPLGLQINWYKPTKLMISEMFRGLVRILDTQTGSLRQLVKGEAPIASALSTDGHRFAYAFRVDEGDMNIRILDTTANQIVATLPSEAAMLTLQWSPDSHYLLGLNIDDTLVLWTDH